MCVRKPLNMRALIEQLGFGRNRVTTLFHLVAISLLMLSSCGFIAQEAQADLNRSEVPSFTRNQKMSSILLPNGDQLKLPVGYEHETTQGDDSFTGSIQSDSRNFVMHYDIGGLAGEYVKSDATEVEAESSVNANFVYAIQTSSNSPILSATFPERGPANFYMTISSQDDDRIKTMLQILRTYEAR